MTHAPTYKRYLELDALRGIAAMMVVLFHYTMGTPVAAYGFKLGTTGVDLFFMISGFVILLSLKHVKTAKDFVINRVSRLYPTYWTVVTFTFLLMILDAMATAGNLNEVSWTQYLGNMTMFQFYLKIRNLDGPYWTMIVEMIFYIFMVALFALKLLKHLKLIGILTCILVVILTTFFIDIPAIAYLIKWIPFLQFVPLFLAGTIFYDIYTTKEKLPVKYGILTLCFVCQIALFEHSGRSILFINHWEYSVMIGCYFFLFVLFVHGKLNWMVSKATLFFGKISYALYLVHQYISLELIIPYFVNELGVNYWITALLVALPIVILVSAGITYFIEVPLSAKMKKRLRSL